MLFVLTTSVAMAAPAEPTMGLVALQTRLDASPSGTLSGYLKTVLRGSTIETMPVTVLAVTDSGDGALILFEVTGAEIDRIGGIASGMSGSPVYIDDAGVDTLVGALSYGDIFTKSGTGLATPIEAMMALEITYPMSVPMILSEPVLTESGMKDRVILTQDPAAFTADAQSGALVAAPLSSVFVGGIDPRSNMFKSYSARMLAAGLNVVPLGGSLGTSRDGFTTDFEPGSSVAALATRGDLWVGGIGTVTYANGPSVLAFGHPVFWGGASSLYLSNAWIDGVWPSTYEPYKMGRPGALRGTVTQDRSAGVLGQVGVMADESPVTAHALNADSGQVADTSVFMPRAVINSSSSDYSGLSSLAAYVAGDRVIDVWAMSGSALTTTTVVVNDGTDQYTIKRANIVDDGFSIADVVTADVDEMVGVLQSVSAEGLAHADIVSVNLESEITHARRTAQIVDVQVPGGIRAGNNLVKVSLRQYGVAATRTVDVTMTIPNDVPLTGELSCTGQDESSEFSGDGPDIPGLPKPTFDRMNVKDAVDMLNGEASNNALSVTFAPSLSDEELEEYRGLPIPTFEPISTSTLVDTVVTGSKSKTTTMMDVYVLTPQVSYGVSGIVEGTVLGIEENGVVSIYGTYPGASERLIKTAAVTFDGDAGFFRATVPYLRSNIKLRFVYSGDSTSLGCTANASIKVAARVGVRVSATRIRRGAAITVEAATTPSTATGKLVFERYYRNRWVAITSRTLVSGSARMSYRPPVGALLIRAHYLGSAAHVGSTSRVVILVVK